MSVETPEQTLYRFTEAGWINEQPTEVVAADLVSSGNESRREWDSFYYEEKDGRLFDPVRKTNITNTCGGDKSQEKVNRDLEDWFLTHDSGIAIRISPSGGMWKYPDEQVEIYRISYSFPDLGKKLLCSFHQFHALLKNPEEIRQFIFPEDDKEESILQVISWIERISQTKIDVNLRDSELRSQQALHYASMLKSGVDPAFVFQEMTRSGFLGENPIGCSSTINSENSASSESELTNTEWHLGKCRICGNITQVGGCNICAMCVLIHFSNN